MDDVMHASEEFVTEKLKGKQDRLSEEQLSKIANALTDASAFDGAGAAQNVRAELLEEIGKIGTLKVVKVDVRPPAGESGIIYLVPSRTYAADNVCDEYLWIDGRWELIGSTAVDLSGYAKKEDVEGLDEAIAAKRDKTDNVCHKTSYGRWTFSDGVERTLYFNRSYEDDFSVAWSTWSDWDPVDWPPPREGYFCDSRVSEDDSEITLNYWDGQTEHYDALTAYRRDVATEGRPYVTDDNVHAKGVRDDGSPADDELHSFFTKSDTFATDHKLKNAALEDSVNALIDYKVGDVNAVLAAALDGTEVS